MSLDALQLVIVIVAGLLIIEVAVDVFRKLSDHNEIKRERFLEETRDHQRRR